MSVTVERVLEDPLFAQCRLLTGIDQARANEVRWVSVIEVPVQRFVRRNEFVLSTAMNVGHDARLLGHFVRRIADSKAAALAIAIGPYVRSLPPQVVSAAASRNLCLIEIRPWKLRFSEISERILQWLLEDQFRKRERDQLVWALATGRLVPDARATAHARRLGAILDSDFYAAAALVQHTDASGGPPTEEVLDEILRLAESAATRAGVNWLGTTISGRIVAFVSTTPTRHVVDSFLDEWLVAAKQRFPRHAMMVGASDVYRSANTEHVATRFVDAATAALDIVELAAEGGADRLARFRDVAVDVLFRRTAVNPLSTRLVDEYLRALVQHDRSRKVKLLPTLEAFLWSDNNVSACARTLGIRRQSLMYRLDRIEQITGCRLDDAHQRFALQVAVRLRHATAATTRHAALRKLERPQ